VYCRKRYWLLHITWGHKKIGPERQLRRLEVRPETSTPPFTKWPASVMEGLWPTPDKRPYQDLGLGVLTMMRNRRQSLSAHAGERLPALASRVTVLSHS